MLSKIGIPELLVVLAIVLIIFGPKQLPKLGKAFSRTIKGFRDGVTGDDEETAEKVENVVKEEKSTKE